MVRKFLLQPDPFGTPRNPFHVFLFVVVLINGVTMLTLGIPTSAVLDRAMSSLQIHIYGGILFTGSFGVLCGMYWPGDARSMLLMKRVGYFALFVGTIVFSVAVLDVQEGVTGVLSSSVAFSFGLICLHQQYRVNRRIKELLGQPNDAVNGDGLRDNE